MAVTYRKMYFDSDDREMVSNQWFVLLYNIHKHADIEFNVNEGHRTMARQAELVAEKGLWHPTRNRTGAAAPSSTAPHIRTGRPDHAIDVDGAPALIQAAARRGVTLRRTVPGEPWHLEADTAQLNRYYNEKSKAVWAELKKKKQPTKPKKNTTKSATTIDAKGVEAIAKFEGSVKRGGRHVPYRDAVGVWTIGYGHTSGVGPKSKSLTEKQAQDLLRKDLNEVYVPPVVRAFKRNKLKLRQRELNALASAVYNLGPGILEPGRTMGDAIRSHNKSRIANALLVYNKAGGKVLAGLVTRRKAERKMFLG
jgi:GH24 family phage-related lysozyme (muramidase)